MFVVQLLVLLICCISSPSLYSAAMDDEANPTRALINRKKQKSSESLRALAARAYVQKCAISDFIDGKLDPGVISDDARSLIGDALAWNNVSPLSVLLGVSCHRSKAKVTQESAIIVCAFSPCGNYVVTGCEGGQATRHNITTHEEFALETQPVSVTAAAVNEDVAVVGYRNGAVCLLDSENRQYYALGMPVDGVDGALLDPIHTIVLRNDGTFFTSHNDSIRKWQAIGEKPAVIRCVLSVPVTTIMDFCVLSADEKKLLAVINGANNHRVIAMDVDDDLRPVGEGKGFGGVIHSIAYHDDRRVLMGNPDGVVVCNDLRTNTEASAKLLQEADDIPAKVAVSHSGQFAVVAKDNDVTIFDTHRAHGDWNHAAMPLASVATDAPVTHVATTSDDSKVLLAQCAGSECTVTEWNLAPSLPELAVCFDKPQDAAALASYVPKSQEEMMKLYMLIAACNRRPQADWVFDEMAEDATWKPVFDMFPTLHRKMLDYAKEREHKF